MRNALAAVSVLGLAGLAGLVGWSTLTRPAGDFVTGDAAKGFNLDAPAPASPAPRPAAAPDDLRDAVAAPASSLPGSLSPRPIAYEGMAVAGRPAPAAAPAGPVVPVTPKAEAWARKNKWWTALLAKPAALLARGSSLGNARDMRAFLADPRKVDAYLNSTLTRVVLNSPTAAKALLGNPAVVRAALASPALQDPQALRELLASPMLRKMLDCPGVQEALADEGVMRRMWTDPQTVAWIASHPQALSTIAAAAPALAEGFAR